MWLKRLPLNQDEWLKTIVQDALWMRQREWNNDIRYPIGLFTELWLCPQMEKDGMHWHVRTVSNTAIVIDNIFCDSPLMLMAATAHLLKQQGISL